MAGTPREYVFSLEQLGVKLGLDQIRALVVDLGRPDLAYRSIVVAGTNGKGSVTAMIERGLRAAGYRTGRYTSPHLVGIEERIAIDGQPISADQFDTVADRIRDAARRLPAPPSFFEATTAAALEAFRRAAVDVAVLEVGLGGRLDATNVISPVGVAITSIDFDHEQYLGDTIDAIAQEKAGVIKPGAFTVLAENSTEVRQVVQASCDRAGAPFIFAPDDVHLGAEMIGGRTRLTLRTPRADYGQMTLGLRGRHQIANAVTAARVLEALTDRQLLAISPAAVQVALTAVEWPGRLELRQQHGRDVLIDGAHNPAGARALAAYIQEVYGCRLPFVFGAMRDKKIDQMIGAMAASASCIVCTASDTPRAASPAELAAVARHVAPALEVIEVTPPMAALAAALSRGTPAVVAGSLYLAGEIRAELS